ncbi:MAG: hypothetical protein NW201_13785 [Gemmatimonadales bacterium]|nr:hypothetical protein [Gemmatimonadales bacterium]
MRAGALAALLALGLAAPAAAQTLQTPVFKAPYRAFGTHEVSGALSFPSGFSVAAEGGYGFGYRQFDLSLRGGFARFSGTGLGTRAMAGVDGRARVVTADQRFPLDGAITAGAAFLTGGSNGVTTFFVPVGLSLGRRFLVENSTVSIVPYVQPVMGLSFQSGNSDVGFSLGFGADVRLNERLDLRVSAGLGDIQGVAFGVAFIR